MKIRLATLTQLSILTLSIAALGPACDTESADQPEDFADDEDESELADSRLNGEDIDGDGNLDALESHDPQLTWAGDQEAISGRWCSQNNHCRSACECSGNLCVPDMFGPPPPSGYCDLPPERACSSHSDCQSSCQCSGGFCVPDGFGPSNPFCFLPPADAYENDDSWSDWSAYVGTPQDHNFDMAGDEDWVAVYFGYAINARFQTYGLNAGTNTVLEVYKMTSQGELGKFVGENDDIGGPWWIPDSLGSRVDVAVPANSVYLIRVRDISYPSVYTDSLEFPRYTLSITAI